MDNKTCYSRLTIKQMNDDQRTFTGVASTPTPDRMQDIVEPLGAQYELPIPLLWQHDAKSPVGEVTAVNVTSKGINIAARLVNISEPGSLKDRLDSAWLSIKHGLVKALSIGFSPVEYSYLENGGIHFQSWNWLELSCVTIPATQQATIGNIKRYDFRKRQPVVFLPGYGPRKSTQGRPLSLKGAFALAGEFAEPLREIVDSVRAANMSEAERKAVLKGLYQSISSLTGRRDG